MKAEAGDGLVAVVAVVGSINTDYLLRIEKRPRPGETVADAVLEVQGGGKGANQALAATKCGAHVDLVGRVGDDAMGAARVSKLEAHGLGVGRVLVTPGVASGIAVITLTPDGQNDIIVAPGANARLSPADVEEAAREVGRASVVLAQLEIPTETVVRTFELAGDKAYTVLNCAPFRPLPPETLRRLDVLVANELETAELSGQSVSSPEDALVAARAILKLGPRAVVVTLGERGAVVVSDDIATHVPAPTTRVVDTTGAGDAFTGALAAKLAAGASLAEAVPFGVAVASATTERLGAEAVVPERLTATSAGP